MSAYHVEAAANLGRFLVASRSLPAGFVFDRLERVKIKNSACKYSVQISETEHILVPRNLSLLNHSCEPNLYIDTKRLAIFSLRFIHAGDPLTFFYPSTEWDMVHPFDCHCGSHQCLGHIQGAKHLDAATLNAHRLNAHIAKLAAKSGLLQISA